MPPKYNNQKAYRSQTGQPHAGADRGRRRKFRCGGRHAGPHPARPGDHARRRGTRARRAGAH